MLSDALIILFHFFHFGLQFFASLCQQIFFYLGLLVLGLEALLIMLLEFDYFLLVQVFDLSAIKCAGT